MKEEVMKQVKIGRKWYDVPNEAKWVTQDRSGEWFWYREVPHLYEEYWYSYKSLGYITFTATPEDFTQELYELED